MFWAVLHALWPTLYWAWLTRAETAVILAEFCYLGAGDQGVVDAKGAVLVPQAEHAPRPKNWKEGVSFKTLRINCSLTLLQVVLCQPCLFHWLLWVFDLHPRLLTWST